MGRARTAARAGRRASGGALTPAAGLGAPPPAAPAPATGGPFASPPAALALAAPAHAAPALVTVGQFASPTYATGAPGDANRVFVTERGGHVRVIDGSVRDFLDLSAITSRDSDERGLLSIAFAPDYA